MSCSKEVDTNNAEKDSLNIIPRDLALKVAERVNTEILSVDVSLNSKLKSRSLPLKTILNTVEIPDKFGNTALYVFNYVNNGGFSVISADERYDPICALVDTGKFGIDTVPSSFVSWFEATLENIEMVRYDSFDNTAAAKRAWIDLFDKTDLVSYLLHMSPVPFGGDGAGLFPNANCCPDCPNYPDCIYTPNIGCGGDIDCGPRDPNPCGLLRSLIIGPLVKTEWGQGCTYNDQCEDKNCDIGCGSNHRAWTGCVATAMAQILKYWSHPNRFNYNYSIMPLYYGNFEVQRMMKDIGEEVDMHYSCDGSSASMLEADEAFTDDFNFSTSLYDGFNLNWCIQDLNAHRPLILSGCRDRINIFLGEIFIFEHCHAWVCDGYWKQWDNCTSYATLLHMNWGWNEFFSSRINNYNGWYSYYYWNPGTRNYQFYQHFIHNLKP